LPLDRYTTNRRTGAFLVIDPSDGGTLAAGLVGAPLPVLVNDDPIVSDSELVSPGP
jgi:sulfate adenylyltransferase subunit 1